MGQEFKYGPYILELTCQACPEQYNVWTTATADGSEQKVAYLRLRRGKFRCDVPDVFGETIYTASPKGDGFFEVDERDKYLNEAVNAIIDFYKTRSYEEVITNYNKKQIMDQ